MCIARSDLQHAAAAPRRSSPAHDLRCSPSRRLKKYKCNVSCQLVCNARTCDDRHAAAPTSSSTMKRKTPKRLMRRNPGSAFRGEQPNSPRRATCPGRRESAVISSRLRKTLPKQSNIKLMGLMTGCKKSDTDVTEQKNTATNTQHRVFRNFHCK